MCKDVEDLEVRLAPENKPLSGDESLPQVSQVEGTFKLNIISMIQMAKEAAPHLRRGSSIINTTSVTAYKVQ